MSIQVQIPAALYSIHNFIHFHDPGEGKLPDTDYPGGGMHGANLEQEPVEAEASAAHNDLRLRHDRIAEEMWVDYQRILQERTDFQVANDDEDFLEQGYDEYELD
jgi:hypothetical protein